MFKKNEMLKTAILTGLVLFATIGLFTVVMAPLGGINQAHAFWSNSPVVVPKGPNPGNCQSYFGCS